MSKSIQLSLAFILIYMTASLAQETQPYPGQGKDPYTSLFYGNMFYRNNVPFQSSPPESSGGNTQTQYFYGPDGSFQGYSTQSGDTNHYYGGDGSYQGSSYKKSNDQNFYSSDGRTKSGSIFYGR